MATSTSAADALQKLIDQFNQASTYTPKTADEIRSQAEGEYKSYYDQLRLAAQQSQARQDLALQQQREGLQATYDKQREASRKEYEQAYSKADRQQLSRGMQRSSYTAQVLANLQMEGAEAQQDLWDAQGTAEGNVDAQRTQLAAQLAEQLSQYSANEAADVLARIKELEDQEYERGQTSEQYKNSLSAQIYQFMYQAEQDKIAQDQWQKEFDENVRQWNAQYGGSGSSGGSGGSSGGSGSSGSSGSSSGASSALYDTSGLLNALNKSYNTVTNSSFASGIKKASSGISSIISGLLNMSKSTSAGSTPNNWDKKITSRTETALK